MEILRLALYQFAPRLGDAAGNLDRIARHVAGESDDLVLTPELSLTGYDLGDDAAHLATTLTPGERMPAGALAGVSAHVVVGLPERGDGGILYNSLAVLQRGVVQFRHRKVYLPTYGMFDEGRFFGRGREIVPWQLGGWRLGLLICEDLWHPGLTYVLAAAGIHVLLVAAAAPGRGIRESQPERGEPGRFANIDGWERIVRTTAQLYGIWVALANRTGVEGSCTFAGGSMIVAPDGQVVARAGDGEETVLRAELRMQDLDRFRRPFAHARDEDHRLVIESLQHRDRA